MEEKKVKDVMLPIEEYATILVGSTVQEALAALNKAQLGLTYDRHHHRAILVLDTNGDVVGKLTHLSILGKLQPQLLGNDDIQFLDRAGLTPEFVESMEESYRHLNTSLETLCARAGGLRVEDAMVPTFESIGEDATIAEAISRVVSAHVQSILVTRHDKVVGILRTSDLFEEVADLIRGTGSLSATRRSH
ncbi:MAG: CBS domain-containing protein [Deltaproteobacteria bacterium]|nr:CBS domain-containing protein [Deltaproteobacteria bacterium]